MADRTVTAGDVGLLRFEFENNALPTGYDITIILVSGDTLTFTN